MKSNEIDINQYTMSLRIDTDKYIVMISSSNHSSSITIYDKKNLEEVDDREVIEYIKKLTVGDLVDNCK